jgi:hypothetical protein
MSGSGGKGKTSAGRGRGRTNKATTTPTTPSTLTPWQGQDTKSSRGTVVSPSTSTLHTAMQGIKSDLTKHASSVERYKKNATRLNAMNKKLTESYVSNIHVMVDLSGLLSQLRDFVTFLGSQMKMLNIGETISLDHVKYLEGLTTDHMMNMQAQLRREIPKIAELYKDDAANSDVYDRLTEFTNPVFKGPSVYAKQASMDQGVDTVLEMPKDMSPVAKIQQVAAAAKMLLQDHAVDDVDTSASSTTTRVKEGGGGAILSKQYKAARSQKTNQVHERVPPPRKKQQPAKSRATPAAPKKKGTKA